jgi:N-acetylglucosaminyl-diphospho-decaprenol L-rhamnosyltransferase
LTVDLRIVVLTYGAGNEHEGLLDSLRRDGVDPERVVIVHNPSRPGERGPSIDGVETITTSHNLGYAAGMNVGIRRVLTERPELVLVLTHDARLREGGLAALLAAAAAHPEYGALGPVLVHAGTERPFSFGGVTDANGHVGHRHEPAAGVDGLLDCDWIDGGTMLLRAQPLAALGGFDERLWSYFEDADLCLRISRAGLGVAVVLDALADQQPGGSKRLAPWSYLLSRNSLAYASSFAGRRRAAKIAVRRLWGAALGAVNALARRLGLRAGDPVAAWALSVGTTRGVLDFARGHWGPPPAGMPGGGDITNVDPPGDDG